MYNRSFTMLNTIETHFKPCVCSFRYMNYHGNRKGLLPFEEDTFNNYNI